MNMGSTTHTRSQQSPMALRGRLYMSQGIDSVSFQPIDAHVCIYGALCLVEPKCLYRLYYATNDYI